VALDRAAAGDEVGEGRRRVRREGGCGREDGRRRAASWTAGRPARSIGWDASCVGNDWIQSMGTGSWRENDPIPPGDARVGSYWWSVVRWGFYRRLILSHVTHLPDRPLLHPAFAASHPPPGRDGRFVSGRHVGCSWWRGWRPRSESTCCRRLLPPEKTMCSSASSGEFPYLFLV
jgi:hypothetical protein